MIPMHGIITKDNSAWIKKMGLGLCTWPMATNLAAHLSRMQYKDMEPLQIQRDKKYQEYGTKTYWKNFE